MAHKIRFRVLDEGMQWDVAVALRHRWIFRSSEAWRAKGRKQALSRARWNEVRGLPPRSGSWRCADRIRCWGRTEREIERR